MKFGSTDSDIEDANHDEYLMLTFADCPLTIVSIEGVTVIVKFLGKTGKYIPKEWDKPSLMAVMLPE